MYTKKQVCALSRKRRKFAAADIAAKQNKAHRQVCRESGKYPEEQEQVTMVQALGMQPLHREARRDWKQKEHMKRKTAHHQNVCHQWQHLGAAASWGRTDDASAAVCLRAVRASRRMALRASGSALGIV